jgi:hypothetical protein
VRINLSTARRGGRWNPIVMEFALSGHAGDLTDPLKQMLDGMKF